MHSPVVNAGTMLQAISIPYTIEDNNIESISLSLSKQSFGPASTITNIPTTPSGFTLTPGNYEGTITVNSPSYENSDTPLYYILDISVTVNTSTITELRVNSVEAGYSVALPVDLNLATVTVINTPRTVVNKFQEAVSVKDYGAVGDGVTNDWQAFKTATEAIRTTNASGLYVPRGTYMCTATNNGTISIDDITLYGDGKGISIVKLNAATTAYYAAFTVLNNATVRDLTLQVIPAAGAVANTNVVLFYVNSGAGTSNFTLERCELDGTMVQSGVTVSHSAYALSFGNGTGTGYFIDGCDIHGFNFVFLNTNAATGTVTNFRVTNNHFHDNFARDCVFNTPNGTQADILISGNTFDTNRGYLLTPPATSGAISLASAKRVRIIGNSIDGVYLFNAIHLEEDVEDFVIDSNIIRVDGWGITSQANNVHTSGTYTVPHQGVISNNVVEFLPTGFAVGAHSGITIVFDDNFSSNSSGKRIVISNNVVNGAFTYGYRIAAYDTDAILISNNIARGCDNGFATIINCFNLSNNLSDECGVGVAFQVTSGGLDTHRWNNCTANVSTTAGQVVTINGGIFTMPLFNINASENKQFPLLPLGANDRLNVQASINCYRLDSIATRYYTIVWDGTTFTATSLAITSSGALVPSFIRSGDFLVLSIFSASTLTNVTLRTSLTGFYAIRT